jgi:hypothetical protein
MTHLVRNETWAIIDLDLTKGHVLVRQDWLYEWLDVAGAPPWTEKEKRDYHNAVDHLVWAFWSMRVHLMVRGQPGMASTPTAAELHRRFHHKGLTLSFDIRAVSGKWHWRATVVKPVPGRPKPNAKCLYDTRQLQLSTIDIAQHRAKRFEGNDPRAQRRFYPAPHEFGHTIGNVSELGRGDEYSAGSTNYEDVHSIMNIGRAVRSRHLFLVVETLRRMVAGCTFTAIVGR